MLQNFFLNLPPHSVFKYAKVAKFLLSDPWQKLNLLFAHGREPRRFRCEQVAEVLGGQGVRGRHLCNC